jgi:hypothetical protein
MIWVIITLIALAVTAPPFLDGIIHFRDEEYGYIMVLYAVAFGIGTLILLAVLVDLVA